MAIYETVFMMRQDLADNQVKDMTDLFSKLITDQGGKILKVENWGLRALAYPINKNRKAHYVLIETEAKSDVLIELERNLRLNEDVLRSMTVLREKASEGPSVILEKAREEREPRRYDSEKEAA